MISRLLLPSAVRLETYSCVRRSRRIRARQIMYSARLASRFPPRLRRCRTTLPEEASTGETPHRLAKEASLLNLLGLSLRPRSRASRRCRCRCPPKRPTPGPLAPPAGRGAPLARRSLPRVPRNGEPPNAARTWSQTVRREGHLRVRRGRPPRRAPSSRAHANVGAVAPAPSRAILAAGWQLAVLAFIAERRAARRVLIISTRPSALLGVPDASPANTTRAALSASEGSDLTLRRELRCRRFGRSTSSTSIPLALRWRASPAP